MDFRVKFDGRGCFGDEIVSHIMADRGIDEGFIYPKSKDMLPLKSLKNVDNAYELLKKIASEKKSIAILADTDTDGVTSGTIMYRYLEDMGLDPDIFINHGKSHGLDRREPYYEKLDEFDLLIVVDSLNNTIDEYKELHDKGVAILVLDHHMIDPDVPYSDYVLLVSSQDGYKNPQLSGAGVVWKFCKYIDSKEKTKFADKYVDLAAIGISSDVMDMTVPENRYIVYKGLKNLQNLAVKKIVGSYEFNSRGILFSVAPLINAANRMDENETALNALLEDDNKTVLALLRVLKKCKAKQDDRVTEIIEETKDSVEKQVKDDAKFLFVEVDNAHGLNGLVATKLADKYDRPTFAVTYGNDGYYRGSLRCNDDFDLSGAVNATGIARAMGHEGAAGFELPEENKEDFFEELNEALKHKTADTTIDIDVQLSASDFDMYLANLIHDIDYVSGKNFKPITFLVEGIDDYSVKTWKEGKHLLLECGNNFTVIKWNSPYSTERFDDAAIFEEPFRAYGTIQIGGYGRSRGVWLIADEIELME